MCAARTKGVKPLISETGTRFRWWLYIQKTTLLFVFVISLSTMFILALFKIHLSLRGACEWRVCSIFVGAAISICQSSTITAVTEEINVASVLFPLIATTGWWVSPYYGWIPASSIFLFTSCFFKGSWHNFVRAAISFSDLRADDVNAFEYCWAYLQPCTVAPWISLIHVLGVFEAPIGRVNIVTTSLIVWLN